jgi:hypothetical protein
MTEPGVGSRDDRCNINVVRCSRSKFLNGDKDEGSSLAIRRQRAILSSKKVGGEGGRRKRNAEVGHRKTAGLPDFLSVHITDEVLVD